MGYVTTRNTQQLFDRELDLQLFYSDHTTDQIYTDVQYYSRALLRVTGLRLSDDISVLLFVTKTHMQFIFSD